MTTYTAYYRSDQDWTSRDFDASTPAEALALARNFYDERSLELDNFRSHDEVAGVNEIAIEGTGGYVLAVWQDDDLRLRRAAPDLLAALEQAVSALNRAPRFSVPSLDTDSYVIAATCDRAIARARPEPE